MKSAFCFPGQLCGNEAGTSQSSIHRPHATRRGAQGSSSFPPSDAARLASLPYITIEHTRLQREVDIAFRMLRDEQPKHRAVQPVPQWVWAALGRTVATPTLPLRHPPHVSAAAQQAEPDSFLGDSDAATDASLAHDLHSER